jgi:hypothetical protein
LDVIPQEAEGVGKAGAITEFATNSLQASISVLHNLVEHAFQRTLQKGLLKYGRDPE